MSGLHIPEGHVEEKEALTRRSKENRQWLRTMSSTQPTLDPGENTQEDSLCHIMLGLPFQIWDPLGMLGGNVLNCERDFMFQISTTPFSIPSPLGSKVHVELYSFEKPAPSRGVKQPPLRVRKSGWRPYHKPVSKMSKGCRPHAEDWLSSRGCSPGLEKNRFKAMRLAPTKFSGQFPQSTKDSEASKQAPSWYLSAPCSEREVGSRSQRPH